MKTLLIRLIQAVVLFLIGILTGVILTIAGLFKLGKRSLQDELIRVINHFVKGLIYGDSPPRTSYTVPKYNPSGQTGKVMEN